MAQIGQGVSLKQVSQEFSQGNISTSGNSLDLAIQGNGFFQILLPDGTTALTMALINAHWELAATLLDRGADPNGDDPRGRPLQVLARLDELGFRLYDICTFWRRPVDHALWQADFCFVRKDSPYGAASLGYWVGEPYAKQGFMTRAVKALVPAAFDLLRLHRIEAACIPTNIASVKLLEKTGFQREGYARQYLCINGIWQDHLLYAQLRSDPRA